jgi:hypothetical protein
MVPMPAGSLRESQAMTVKVVDGVSQPVNDLLPQIVGRAWRARYRIGA